MSVPKKDIDVLAAESLASRYSTGRSCDIDSVADDVGSSKKQLLRAIKWKYGGLDVFTVGVTPKRTKTIKCCWCREVMQISARNTRVKYCLTCKQRCAINILKLRKKRKLSVTVAAIRGVSHLRWIVDNPERLWGKPPGQVFDEVFCTENKIKATARKRKKKATSNKKLIHPIIREGRPRDELVMKYLGVVYKYVNRVYQPNRGRCMSKVDLIQEGIIGLIRAAERYDPEKSKCRFFSYATWWIRQAVTMAWLKQNFPVKVQYPRAKTKAVYGAAHATTFKLLTDVGQVFNKSIMYPARFTTDQSEEGGAPVPGRMDQGFDEVCEIVDAGILEQDLISLAKSAGVTTADLRLFCLRVFGEMSLTAIGNKYDLAKEQIRRRIASTATRIRDAYLKERGSPRP